MSGKGDKPRPIDKAKYDNNFDEINWKNKKTHNKKEVEKNNININIDDVDKND